MSLILLAKCIVYRRLNINGSDDVAGHYPEGEITES